MRCLALLPVLALSACKSGFDTVPSPAIEGDALTLERVVSDGSLHYRGAPRYSWIDGSAYSVADDEGLGAVDARTGERRVVAARELLIPAGTDEPLDVESWTVTEDGTKAVLFTNSQRVWRDNTSGDYWVLDLVGGGLLQLGADFDPGTLMFAKLSPDGTRAAYVQAHDLWVEDLASGERTRLTEGGSDTLIHGTFDWVYEEELGLQDGFAWSPDGTRIAFWQLDSTGVGSFPLVDELTSPYPTVKWLPYPKAGTTNSAARVGVIAATGGEVTWLRTPGDQRESYVARMEWIDADSLAVQHLDRAQRNLTLLRCDADSGATETWHTEQDDAWLDLQDRLTWIDAERTALLWISERDGWRRPYTLARAGALLRPLHGESHDLVEVAHVDRENGVLYYIASPHDPTQRYLYAVALKGGTPRRVTPEDAPGWNRYDVSPDGGTALYTASSFTGGQRVSLISLPDHAELSVLENNAATDAALGELLPSKRELFRVRTAEGIDLDGYAIYPPDFDPKLSWPVLFYVYGEPWGQTVQDRVELSSDLWHRYLTQQGYVVMSLDNRGTPAPRGREWRKCIAGNIGTISSRDQAQGLRALLARHSWMDPERIAIWGWSGGGSMTLNMMFRYPELYSTGIAVASVPDQRLYDTIYQERYMGLPQENVEGYAAASPIHYAEGLAGNLLLVHGTGDDNVHMQGVWQLIDRLVAAQKPFEMMAYPSRSHGIYEREGTTAHLFATMTRYLGRNLPAGPRER